MQTLTDAIDALRIALQTEMALRQATNIEWANGDQNGPMKRAHDISIQQIIIASKNLVNLSNS